ncbi:MAG: hypothetical protein JSV86_06825, partial [Gemmatimonadota bacterium]
NALGLLQLASGREQDELARMFQAEQARLNRGFQGRMDPFERELLQARAAQARASSQFEGMSPAEAHRKRQGDLKFAMGVRDYGMIKNYLTGEGVLPEQLGADVYAMATELGEQYYRFAFGSVLAGRSPTQFRDQLLERKYPGKKLEQLTKDQQRTLLRDAQIEQSRYANAVYEAMARAMWEKNGRMGKPSDYMESAEMLVPDPYRSSRGEAPPFNEGESTRPPVPSVAPEDQPKPPRGPGGSGSYWGGPGAGQRMPWGQALPPTPWSQGTPDVPSPGWGTSPPPEPAPQWGPEVMPPPREDMWGAGSRPPQQPLKRSGLLPFDPLSPPMTDLPPMPEGRQAGAVQPPAPAPTPIPFARPPVLPATGTAPEGVETGERENLPVQLRKYGSAAPEVRDAYMKWRTTKPAIGQPGGAELPERLRTFRNWEEMGMPGYAPERDMRGSDSRLDQAIERNLATLPEVTRRALAQGSPRDVTGMVIPSGVDTQLPQPSIFARAIQADRDLLSSAGMDLNAMIQILGDMYQGNYDRARRRAEDRGRR